VNFYDCSLVDAKYTADGSTFKIVSGWKDQVACPFSIGKDLIDVINRASTYALTHNGKYLTLSDKSGKTIL
jgi:hypothetical protein